MNIWIEAKGRRAKREREIFITQRTGGRSVLLLFAHDRRVDLASRTDGEIVGNTRIRLRSSNLWGIKAAAFIVVDAISYVGSTDEKDEPTSIWIFLFSQRDQTINQTIWCVCSAWLSRNVPDAAVAEHAEMIKEDVCGMRFSAHCSAVCQAPKC